MYLSTAVFFLAASGVKATAVLAQRAPSSNLVARDTISQGWSLQASSAPDETHSCGNGAYCPISLHCNTIVNNDQVAACCSTSGDCRGDVENAPQCADSAWSLWIGYDGNGFCCEGGAVGAYDISQNVAGVCVAAGDIGTLRPAVLTSTGSGAAATLASLSASFSSSTAAAATSGAATITAAITPSSTTASTPKSSNATAPTSTGGATTATAASNSTGSATSSSASAKPTANGAERFEIGLGLMGAAFLAVAAL